MSGRLCLMTGMPVFNVTDEAYDGLTDSYDAVSYILATGRDFAEGKETADSKAARAAFIARFPEYTSHSFWKLQFLPENVKNAILDWYFSIG